MTIKLLKYRLIVLSILLVTNFYSQLTNNTKYSNAKPLPEKDIIDFFKFKRPKEEMDPKAKNLRKPRITVVPFVGYTLQTRLAGLVAANIAFYTDNDPKTNQSAIVASLSYSQNNQIIAPILSNIWTKKNKYNLLGNTRYYKYPEYTYGLGGHTSSKNPTKLDYSYFLFREAVLRHLSSSSFYAGLGYNLSIHTNIKQSTVPPGLYTDFDRYERNRSSVSSGVSLHALFDNRGNTINPQKGMYGSITYCPYLKIMGGDNNWQSLIIDVRKYLKLSDSKNILALWSYNWFTFNSKAPYLDLPSTGWEAYPMGRGYIQSRFRGANLLYLEAEYRFKISGNGLLGGVIFSNAEAVTDWPSNKFTAIHPAVGTGIRIKLNKFSGTNLSVDYGFGLRGSRGLFINIGEAF